MQLETLSEGRISELHVGLTGTMNQLYLAELARKTRRGLIARVRAGFSGGGRCYGYTVAARGILVVDPVQAAVVRRIFTAFAAGQPASTICHDLEAEGVAAPRGDRWRSTTLLGSPRNGDGILCQELYVGRRVFNRRRFRKHPDTGRRSSVLNPPEEWLREPVPELRILDDALWRRVQARRKEIGGPQTRPREPKRLLSGLLFCASCCGPMTLGGGRYACRAHWTSRSCFNRKVISARRLELAVVEGLLRRLGDFSPSAGPADEGERSSANQRLVVINEQLSRLQTLFVAGEIEIEHVRAKAAPLRKERLKLESQARAAERSKSVRETMVRCVLEARTELTTAGKLADISRLRLLVRKVTFTPGHAFGTYELDLEISSEFSCWS